MPRLSKLSRSKSIHDASITSSSILDFLVPAAVDSRSQAQRKARNVYDGKRPHALGAATGFESLFYTALSQASLCGVHQRTRRDGRPSQTFAGRVNGKGMKSRRETDQRDTRSNSLYKHTQLLPTTRCEIQESDFSLVETSTRGDKSIWSASSSHDSKTGLTKEPERDMKNNEEHVKIAQLNWQNVVVGAFRGVSDTQNCGEVGGRQRDFKKLNQIQVLHPSTRLVRCFHTRSADIEYKQRRFAEGSHLPPNFFDDIMVFRTSQPIRNNNNIRKLHEVSTQPTSMQKATSQTLAHDEAMQNTSDKAEPNIIEQMKLIASVRELEDKLERAKKELSESITKQSSRKHSPATMETTRPKPAVVLTKEDYMNLVDLYYYSHNDRFSPESTDKSPTPLMLNDYSFTLSADFTPGANNNTFINEDENYESPLKHIEEMLKQNKLHEIAVMQVFVDLLLDEHSSNRALYEAYQQFPDPGVAYLPRGIVRLFLQRMSTPWTISEKSMLRYLSLIDDMQKAEISITVAEWSSAVYLAGRAFTKVTSDNVNTAFKIWREMEQEAGVMASHVTFNILFDIAVRSGRFALGETILKEMHSRNLRLNRLGRVSLMYYHGLRKDGDGVRKAYRDFVEAGEIVDTLVLNCVIASLLNAQEPQAAEQIYARMMNMQAQLRKGFDRSGDEVLYKRYPDPGTNTIEQEMASNQLGRILEKAPRLRRTLPEHHQELQAAMPLSPDHVTFRSMIGYHATTSGDLDRLTVLLSEMTDFFHLPLQTITFQLLFKGFAIHGPLHGPQSTWSVRRLDLCWNACRAAIKESEHVYPSSANSSTPQTALPTATAPEPTLPSITQVNAGPQHERLPAFNPPLSRPPPRRLSNWAEFVLDLAAFPHERLKRLERFHATMFDAEDMNKPHEKPGVHTFQDPFFQSVAYTAPEPQLDTEEGEYTLPNPSESGVLHDTTHESDSDDFAIRKLEGAPHQVAATRTLVCWLLRAYARNTKSRRRVEEVWGQVRKVFKPRDAVEREGVVRVLRRCLRDCDREGSG